MPELPEVETVCRGIRRQLVNSKIKNIIVRQRKLRWPISSEMLRLKDIKITKIRRRAKYILIDTDLGAFIIHLGMSGRLVVCSQNQKAGKHDHVDFLLESGQLLRYTDPRRFGSILWIKGDPLEHPLLVNLGYEPFAKGFDDKYLFGNCVKKSKLIKQILMDQKIVVGIGNIYANEALFLARISPLRKGKSLTKADCRTLVFVVRKVLRKAIQAGGTTLRNFFGSDGTPGYFKQKLFVYGREGEACFNCYQPLFHTRINQRATVFCTHCQE